MADALTAHLIELELRLQATATRRDAGEAGSLLSDEFREFGSSGRTWTKATLLAELTAETPYQITSSDWACERLSPDLALLTYHAKTPTRRTLRSSLWRREGDQWRMLFHQGTLIPETAGTP